MPRRRYAGGGRRGTLLSRKTSGNTSRLILFGKGSSGLESKQPEHEWVRPRRILDVASA